MNLDINVSDLCAGIGILFTIIGASWWVGHWMGHQDGVQKYDHSEKGLIQSLFRMQQLFGTGTQVVYQPTSSEATQGTIQRKYQSKKKLGTKA